MSFTVSDQVLEKTIMCGHNFSCLKSGKCGDSPMCEVDEANGQNVLFLNTKDSIVCLYRVLSEGVQICSCPTHFAIYEKYGQ
jgi:hypothetical protein